MDTSIAEAKIAKVAKPIQRPVSVSTPPTIPGPIMVPVTRGVATEIEAPEGAAVQPTLAERTDAENLIPTDAWETSPMFYELANFFNVEAKFYSTEKDKISIVTDWAIEQAKSNKIEDIFHTIRELEDNLYKPNWGESRLDTIYKYLRLAAKRDAADKALRAFERGPRPGDK